MTKASFDFKIEGKLDVDLVEHESLLENTFFDAFRKNSGKMTTKLEDDKSFSILSVLTMNPLEFRQKIKELLLDEEKVSDALQNVASLILPDISQKQMWKVLIEGDFNQDHLESFPSIDFSECIALYWRLDDKNSFHQLEKTCQLCPDLAEKLIQERYMTPDGMKAIHIIIDNKLTLFSESHMRRVAMKRWFSEIVLKLLDTITPNECLEYLYEMWYIEYRCCPSMQNLCVVLLDKFEIDKERLKEWKRDRTSENEIFDEAVCRKINSLETNH